jgi:hypothetical protein
MALAAKLTKRDRVPRKLPSEFSFTETGSFNLDDVAWTGAPQPTHAAALSDISRPHSLHLINAILSSPT